jgi:hypothetical protein
MRVIACSVDDRDAGVAIYLVHTLDEKVLGARIGLIDTVTIHPEKAYADSSCTQQSVFDYGWSLCR